LTNSAELSSPITFRRGSAADADAIADLHADSWRRHYRGAYTDEYLDGPIAEERRAVWADRLSTPEGTATILAESGGELVGFVHVIDHAEPEFGPLIDNLHVRHDIQRSGLGAALMREAARHVLDSAPGAPMHLWVLEQNTRARGFYAAIGGQAGDQRESTPPGGGSVTAIRIVWPDPAAL
jgi:GNAT superfamily N-acetyltransferase